MKRLIAAALINIALAGANASAADVADAAYLNTMKQWRETREAGLRNDNGWLTLAGRFQMKPGVNTFGTGKDNDIVFPPELKGVGPDRLGTIVVDPAGKSVTLKLAKGVWMTSDGKAFAGERALGTGTGKRDWVGLGRMTMHVIEREGRYILRLANNESKVREQFPGRIWYDVNEKYKVEARFVPYPLGKTIPIVNVIDEVSDEPCPGYVEFKLNGIAYKMDVVGEDDGLFFVMRDATAGDTTYRPSRFLFVDKKPGNNEIFTLDFNRAYNPPCAFSEFTTCPLPPEQNILKTRIEAGEKYRKPG